VGAPSSTSRRSAASAVREARRSSASGGRTARRSAKWSDWVDRGDTTEVEAGSVLKVKAGSTSSASTYRRCIRASSAPGRCGRARSGGELATVSRRALPPGRPAWSGVRCGRSAGDLRRDFWRRRRGVQLAAGASSAQQAALGSLRLVDPLPDRIEHALLERPFRTSAGRLSRRRRASRGVHGARARGMDRRGLGAWLRIRSHARARGPCRGRHAGESRVLVSRVMRARSPSSTSRRTLACLLVSQRRDGRTTLAAVRGTHPSVTDDAFAAFHALPSLEVPAIVPGSVPVVGRALSVKSIAWGKGWGHEDPLVVADRPVRPGPRW